jgi:hypothetical protein
VPVSEATSRRPATCAADEASEPLSNVLIYNDEEMPPQP